MRELYGLCMGLVLVKFNLDITSRNNTTEYIQCVLKIRIAKVKPEAHARIMLLLSIESLAV